MAMTCPNGHPVRESFAYCPYCMVKLDHEPPPPEPVVERGPAPEPPVAPPPPSSAPVAGPLPFATPEASPSSPRSSPRARGAVAAAVVAGVLALVLVLVTDGDDDAAAPVPTSPTTATTARRPSTSSSTTTSTTSTTVTTAPPATTVPPPAVVTLGAACDPKAVPPGPMPSTSGQTARCVPQVWGVAEAQHVWWPVDTPVQGEWEVSVRWCDVGRHEATAGGRILSRSDRPRDLHLTVEFVRGDGTVLGAGDFVAPGVAPGDSARWRIDVTGQVADIRECRVAGVRYRP